MNAYECIYNIGTIELWRGIIMDIRKLYETFIISKLEEWDILYIKIEDDHILKTVYDLYVNNKYSNCDNEIYLHYAGLYAKYFVKDDDLSEKYYLEAIDKGYVVSMNNLALQYLEQKKELSAEKYLLMAVEKGYSRSMNSVALMYDNQKKYDLAEKYYLMAIEKENVQSMFNLALFYYERKTGYELVEKYLLMASERGDSDSMYELARLYSDIHKYESSEYYYILSALNYNKLAIYMVNTIIASKFDLNNSVKLFHVLNDHNRNILNDVLKFLVKYLIITS